MLGESEYERLRRELLDWIERYGGMATVRDVTHGIRAYRSNPDKAQEDLDKLVTDGYLVGAHVAPSRKGGRPRFEYRLKSVTETPALAQQPGVLVSVTPATMPAAQGPPRIGDRCELAPRALGALLVEVGAAGVGVSSHPSAPDRLRDRPSELPTRLAARLAFYKPDLLRLLKTDFMAPDPESTYVLGERLGIAQELGMSTEPGSPGWLVAFGEAMETAWKEAEIGP